MIFINITKFLPLKYMPHASLTLYYEKVKIKGKVVPVL